MAMTDRKTAYSLNIPDTGKPRVVIIGGGFGGINLLKRLNHKTFQIVLFDRFNYHTFQPLLYQVATAGLEPDSVAGPLRKLIRKKDDFYFRMLTVHRVDPEEQTVETSAGSLAYDYLVVASGSRINFFNNESISANSFPLKQVTHALDLRSTIFQQFEKLEVLKKNRSRDKYLNFVVVGAGPTGVELCGALAELRKHVLPKDYPHMGVEGMQIYLVEGLDRVLPFMSPHSSRKAQKYLEKMGVRVILKTLTESYDGHTVKLNNGEEIMSNTLIWAAGVKGNVIGGFDGEKLVKGRIPVNEINQVVRDPESGDVLENVFAIGDVAYMENPGYPKGLPGLAPVAIQQGKHLAKNLKRMDQGKEVRPFVYKNKGVMATIGRNRAVADLSGNLHLSGLIGWFFWMVVHLMYLVGFRNKAVVLTNWIWNYFTYDRGIRLILRPSTKTSDPISREIAQEMHESGK